MAKSSQRRLSLAGLVAIIYYSVCGGPFGIEEAVSAAGPLLCIIGLTVMPLIWSLPEALVTAELATTFPDNAGYVAWVQAAFGPFWGFMEGYLSWVAGVVDNAVYPVLFCEYLRYAWPAAGGGATKRICILVFTFALSLLNYFGLGLVGWAALALTVFTLLPFGYVVAVGLPSVEIEYLLVRPEWAEVDWNTFINVLFWNLNYWDSASTLAGEVREPQRTFPLALLIALVLVLLSYLPIVCVGLGVPGKDGASDWRSWQGGALALIANRIGGPVVRLWVICAAAAGNFGLFASEQAENAYQLQGMAELGWLPAAFAQRSRFGTPTASLLLGVVIILALSWLDFIHIVDLLNGVYCLAQLLEFAAFLWLRIKRPDLERPFRVPLSKFGCFALLFPPSMFALGILVAPLLLGDWPQIVFLVAVPTCGALAYAMLGLCRRRHWLTFVREPPGTLEEMMTVLSEEQKQDQKSEQTTCTSNSSDLTEDSPSLSSTIEESSFGPTCC